MVFLYIYIYTNLPVNVIVRLPHPPSGDSQAQETFLAPSADKQTRNYDTECSNHHPPLSTLRPKRLSCSIYRSDNYENIRSYYCFRKLNGYSNIWINEKQRLRSYSTFNATSSLMLSFLTSKNTNLKKKTLHTTHKHKFFT